MKKLLALVFCLMISVVSVAFANPFTVPAKPASSWSLSDAMELVGEDTFAEMLIEVKQNITMNLDVDIGVGFTYSPCLYAIIDALITQNIDPHASVYCIGDDDADLFAYFTVLQNKGFITEIPSSYTEEIANAVRKIQYAAGLPATGEITNALAHGLQIDSAIPSNEETLRFLEPVAGKISELCEREMKQAMEINELISEASRKTVIANSTAFTDVLKAAVRNYTQAHAYLPSFVVKYQFYAPITDALMTEDGLPINEEAVSIVSNSSALLSVLFYYAKHDLKHDYTGYAVEYRELFK